jgi:DNA-binding NtrC family response regulator
MELFSKLKKMKIMLIDDDEWIRDSLSLFLESEGCHLLALESAEEGVEVFKKQPYDIIIADYKLPGMDGLDFFRKIQGRNSHVIKILITAYGSDEVFAEAKRIGIEDIIEKPFTTENIEESLSRLITEHEQINQKSYFEQ